MAGVQICKPDVCFVSACGESELMKVKEIGLQRETKNDKVSNRLFKVVVL